MRILYLTEHSPFERSYGAQQRSQYLLHALERCGTVAVVLLRPGERTEARRSEDPRVAVEATFTLGPMSWNKFMPDAAFTRALRGQLDIDGFDVICARYLGSISKLDLPRTAPVIVDLDDIGAAQPPGGTFLSRHTAGLKSGLRYWLERWTVRRYSCVFFLSARDQARFPHLHGSVLPNIPVPPARAPAVEAEGKTVMFVGSMWYPPNCLGIEWFLKHCWQAIRAAEPDARLLIAGAAPQSVRDVWSREAGVEAPGFVSDLDAAYAAAAFTVVPVFSGGGTNIKVLESLAHGRACVTTQFAMRGFAPHLVSGRDLVVASDAKTMVDACVGLLRDAGSRRALACEGLARIGDYYSFEHFHSVVAKAVANLTESNTRPRR